jgi:hypothetical protein
VPLFDIASIVDLFELKQSGSVFERETASKLTPQIVMIRFRTISETDRIGPKTNSDPPDETRLTTINNPKSANNNQQSNNPPPLFRPKSGAEKCHPCRQREIL